MDSIKFIIEDCVEDENGFSFPTIDIYINNHNLIDLVTEIERKQRNWEASDEISSRAPYIGFESQRFERFRNEMLGAENRPNAILLTCTCTIEMCNCIMAKIEFGAKTVTWHDLKSP